MAISVEARTVIKSDMDATGFVRGAQQMERAADQAATATGRINTATEKTRRTLNESGGAFERLRKSLDDAYRAQQEYERAQKTLNAGLERGKISQAEYNRLLETAKARHDGAAGSVERERRAFESLRQSLDQTYATQKKVAEGEAQIAAAMKRGEINMAEAAALQAKLRESTEKATNSLGLQQHQVKNLTAQVVDFTVQVSSGGGLMMPLIQQGPQVVDALNGPAKALGVLRQVLTPVRIGVAAFAAAVVGSVAVAEAQSAALATLSNRLRATRNDYEALAKSANAAAIGAAGNSAISTSDARASAQTIAGSRNFGGTTAELQSLVELSGRLATVMGTDVSAAAEKLANALNRPTAAAREMAESGLRTMDERLLHTIEGMERSGRVTEAAALTLDAYRRAADGVVKTPLAEAWDKLTQAASRLWHEISPLVEWIGDKLARALAFVIDRVTSFVSGIASAIRSVREFLGLANQAPEAAAPQRSQLDIALEAARNIGGRGAQREAIGQQRQALIAGINDPTATAQDIARLRDSMQSLAEQERGLVGPTEQALRALRNQTEAARAGDGAARDLAEAQIQMREAGGGAAAQAEAMAEVQRRLNEELEQTTKEINRSISVLDAQSNAYETGADSADNLRIAAQATIDAYRFAAAGTEEYARAVERLVFWRTQELEAQRRLRDNQAIRQQADEIAMLERQVELVGASVDERNRELAALRERQRIISESNGDERAADTELAQRRIQNARQIADANTTLERQNDLYNELSNFGSQAFDRIGSAITEAFANGSISAIKFKDIAKAVLSEIIQLAIKLAVINPIKNWATGSNNGTIYDLFTRVGGTAAAGAATNGGSSSTDSASTALAGRTLMGGWPSFSGGSVTGGVGSIYAPGYQANTGLGLVDTAANYNVYGGVSALQAGAGALSIAGGAYGVYSGLQTGGAKGYTQAAGGAVGMAGGAAGLAVASGATGAGGMLAGAAGTAVAATAAWAPYVAAALIIASMLMPGPKQSNAAAGANINLSTGVVNLENSGKETGATAGARDQMVTLVKDTTTQLETLLRGAKASGVLGFELGQRDPSRVMLNGNLVGTAGVGNNQALADLIGKAILQSFQSSPNLADVERRILDASGSNVDFAMSLLSQTKDLVTTFGSDALNPDRNPATRAIYDAAVQTGSIEAVVAALKGAAELTAAYGEALSTADALQVISKGGGNIQKIASDLQWLFEVYKPLTGAAEQISALDQAIAASNKTYNDAIARATELGLATDVLATKQAEAAEKIRQSLRDSYDALLAEAQGRSPVTQAVNSAMAIRGNWNANALDYLKVGRDPNELYAAQMTALFKSLDLDTLERVVVAIGDLDPVAKLFAQAALDAAKATAKANAAASYEAQMREATGTGWVTQIIELSNTIAANADAYRSAGKDPAALYAAQVKSIIDGLDADALARGAAELRGLDSVASSFVDAALQAAQAAQDAAAAAERLAAAAQIAADAADYDAKLRAAMGLDLVNTIVQIRTEIDAMAARYTAAGRDPNVLYTAQVNAALAGQDSATLAKTAAGLQGLDAAAASLTKAALEQAIASDVAAAQQAIAAAEAAAAAQAQQDAANAASQAQQDAAQAAQEAASAQQQAANEAAQAAQQLAQAGQNIKNYLTGLKSSPQAGYSPSERLSNATLAYNADLALAQQGNLDALNRITTSADALIQASRDMYGASSQFTTMRDQIIAQLTALPAVQSADQQIIDKLDSIKTATEGTRTNVGTGNSSLSSISSTTSTTNAKLDEAKALLASIDTNNDGIVTIEEIQAAAQAKITAAQSALTTAAQATATNTGATTTAVGSTTTAVNSNTAKADEVKGEVTANNTMTAAIKDINQTLTNAATSNVGGFVALGTLLGNLTRYSAAAAFNTMYSRPASADPGISISSALGNAFADGDVIPFAKGGIPDVVYNRHVAPLAEFGEAGPEGIFPLHRGPDGSLGVRMYGSNDNGEVPALLRELISEVRGYRRQSAAQAGRADRNATQLRFAFDDVAGPLKRVAAA